MQYRSLSHGARHVLGAPWCVVGHTAAPAAARWALNSCTACLAVPGRASGRTREERISLQR